MTTTPHVKLKPCIVIISCVPLSGESSGSIINVVNSTPIIAVIYRRGLWPVTLHVPVYSVILLIAVMFRVITLKPVIKYFDKYEVYRQNNKNEKQN